MNKSYKTIWNESLGAWVAASELATGRGKSSRSRTAARAVLAAGMLLQAGVMAPSVAVAGEMDGGTVTNKTQIAYGPNANVANNGPAIAIGNNVSVTGVGNPARARGGELAGDRPVGPAHAALDSRWPRFGGAAPRWRQGMAGVLSAYLRSLDIHQVEGIERPLERALIGEHILSMLSFTLEQRGLMSGGETVSSRDHLLHGRMRNWIRDNYSNPAVSASMLADHFNVSVRYVHKVFSIAGRGVTFRDALQCERLDAALRMLRTAANSNTYMAQIAYRCGFSDAAYFGLVFRKAFGCTPRAYGRKLLGEGPADDAMSAAEFS